MKTRLITIVLILTCFAGSFAQIITTVAGNGLIRGLGDGKLATAANLYHPLGVAVDAAGNIFIADANNNRIRKVNTAGIMSTFAGTGFAGYSGDGGPATAATLSLPSDVVLDAAGNVYIADASNNVIRKVSASGTISTLAGGGFAGLGDGGMATDAMLNRPFAIAVDIAGNLYIADELNHRIRKVATSGIITTIAGNGIMGDSGDGGSATDAELHFPEGIAVDAAGNVYIGDTYNARIRKVAASGQISTIAGTGTWGYTGDGGAATAAEISGVFGIAVDNAGNIYFADANNSCIRKVNTSGVISSIAGTGTPGYSGDGGPATAAEMESLDVAVDPAGNVYNVDGGDNGTVRKIDLSGVISTVAGNMLSTFNDDNGPATMAELAGTAGIAIDDNGAIFIANFGFGRIRKVSASGMITTICGNDISSYTGDGYPATAATMDGPTDVLADHSGNLFIADRGNNVVRKIDASGIITTYAGNGFNAGTGIMGGFSGDWGPATDAELFHPSGIALDDAGNMYIADSWNSRIRKVDALGIITTIAGTGAYGSAGDGGPAEFAELNGPQSVCVDKHGNIYIADTWNNRVRRIDASGSISTVAGTGPAGYSGDGGPATAAGLNGPSSVKTDNTGNLYIADKLNNRIRRVDVAGNISTLAGTGFGAPTSGAYSGDGGPATAAELYEPWGMALNAAGDLYFTDNHNYRLRKVTRNALAVHPVPAVASGPDIYPNPACTRVFIQNDHVFPPGSTAVIFDVSGKLIRSYTLSGIIQAIPVTDLTEGVYQCRITTGEKTVAKKIVIVR